MREHVAEGLKGAQRPGGALGRRGLRGAAASPAGAAGAGRRRARRARHAGGELPTGLRLCRGALRPARRAVGGCARGRSRQGARERPRAGGNRQGPALRLPPGRRGAGAAWTASSRATTATTRPRPCSCTWCAGPRRGGFPGCAKRRGTSCGRCCPFRARRFCAMHRKRDCPLCRTRRMADTAFARNYVRHEGSRALETLNPRAVEAIARLAALSRDQSDYIAQQADSVLRERNARGRALRRARPASRPARRGAARIPRAPGLREAGQADVDRLEGLLLPRGRQARQPLRGAAGAGCAGRAARSRRSAHGIHPRCTWGKRDAVRPLFPARRGGAPCLDLGRDAQVLDADAAAAGLAVRARRAGDRVRLLGGGTKEAQRHFTDQKVPRALARPRAGPDMRRGDRLGGGRRAERRLAPSVPTARGP